MIHTKLPPAKGPADGFIMAEKAATWSSWKMLDTGWAQKTNDNAAFSGKAYSKCVKRASTGSSNTALKNSTATAKDILRCQKSLLWMRCFLRRLYSKTLLGSFFSLLPNS
jgi:hypothetical protein